MSLPNTDHSPRRAFVTFDGAPAGGSDRPLPDLGTPEVFVPGVDEAPVSAVFAPDPDTTTRISYQVVRQAILDTRLTVDVTPRPAVRSSAASHVDPDATARIPYSVVRQAIVYSRPVDIPALPVVAPGEIPAPPDEISDWPGGGAAPGGATAGGATESAVGGIPLAPVEVAPTPVAQPGLVATPVPQPGLVGGIPLAPVEVAAIPVTQPGLVGGIPVAPVEVVQPVAPVEVVQPGPVGGIPLTAEAVAVAPAGITTPEATAAVVPQIPEATAAHAEDVASAAGGTGLVVAVGPQRAEIPAETAATPVIDLSQLPPPQHSQDAAQRGLDVAQRGIDVTQRVPDTTQRVPAAARSVPGGRATFVGALHSEMLKLFTLQSTWWVLGTALVVTVGFGIMIMFGMNTVAGNPSLIPQGTMGDYVLKATTATQGAALTQIALAVLAVLVATNEYSSGQIRATLLAAPTRTMVLVAKAVVIGVPTFVVSVIAYWAATIVSWPFIAGLGRPGHDLPSGWTIIDDRFTSEGMMTILGLAIATTLIVLFALAAGMLTRNTAAGIAVVVVLLLVLPSLWAQLAGLFGPWAVSVNSYLLGNCQLGLYSDGAFGFLKSLWVTGLWALIPLVAAGILLKKRDA